MAKKTRSAPPWPPEDLVARLIAHGQALGYNVPSDFGSAGRPTAAVGSPQSAVLFQLEFNADVRRLLVLPWVRTTSWEFDGERTDLHDIFSLTFGLLVWERLGISASLIYEPGYCGKCEMSSVMVSFTQPSPLGFAPDTAGIDAACELLTLACLPGRSLAACEDPRHAGGRQTPGDTGFDYASVRPWAKTVLGSLRPSAPLEGVSFCRRLCPAWTHLFDYRSGATVIRSPSFASACRQALVGRPVTAVEGVHGRLLLDRETRHFVPYRLMTRAARVLRAVGEPVQPRAVPCAALDNRVVFFGTDHAVAFFRSAGRAAFEEERDRVRERFEAESRLLFPATTFDWAERIPAESFEALTCELLAREAGVVRVRRAGVTRERDGGRDLLADWVVPPTDPKAPDRQAPQLPARVVVQCKASSSTVGKGDVRDIRDTVEFHDAGGYFLAVSSEVSGPLIAHLDRLRTRLGWHVDWWTRLELEERLRRHPDVAARYPAVVRPK